MSGTADPWEPPATPALLGDTMRTPHLERTGGPERTYDTAAADPSWQPRPVGFAPARTQPHRCTGRHCATCSPRYDASLLTPTPGYVCHACGVYRTGHPAATKGADAYCGTCRPTTHRRPDTP